jgi:hypothetical protein
MLSRRSAIVQRRITDSPIVRGRLLFRLESHVNKDDFRWASGAGDRSSMEPSLRSTGAAARQRLAKVFWPRVSITGLVRKFSKFLRYLVGFCEVRTLRYLHFPTTKWCLAKKIRPSASRAGGLRANLNYGILSDNEFGRGRAHRPK